MCRHQQSLLAHKFLKFMVTLLPKVIWDQPINEVKFEFKFESTRVED